MGLRSRYDLRACALIWTFEKLTVVHETCKEMLPLGNIERSTAECPTISNTNAVQRVVYFWDLT